MDKRVPKGEFGSSARKFERSGLLDRSNSGEEPSRISVRLAGSDSAISIANMSVVRRNAMGERLEYVISAHYIYTKIISKSSLVFFEYSRVQHPFTSNACPPTSTLSRLGPPTWVAYRDDSNSLKLSKMGADRRFIDTTASLNDKIDQTE